MLFGLNRGEIILVAIIFGLIYVASVLPKIAARLGRGRGEEPTAKDAPKAKSARETETEQG